MSFSLEENERKSGLGEIWEQKLDEPVAIDKYFFDHHAADMRINEPGIDSNMHNRNVLEVFN